MFVRSSISALHTCGFNEVRDNRKIFCFDCKAWNETIHSQFNPFDSLHFALRRIEFCRFNEMMTKGCFHPDLDVPFAIAWKELAILVVIWMETNTPYRFVGSFYSSENQWEPAVNAFLYAIDKSCGKYYSINHSGNERKQKHHHFTSVIESRTCSATFSFIMCRKCFAWTNWLWNL